MRSGRKDGYSMNIDTIIKTLCLEKHPEGGFFREIYRSAHSIGENNGVRTLSTSIYYLLRSGDVSRFHRLKSDELWYYHAGSSITIYSIDPAGTLHEWKLGINLEEGDRPQIIIPAGHIFGASVRDENSFSLIGCMVSPGFDFRDFELMERERLLSLFPGQKLIIEKLT